VATDQAVVRLRRVYLESARRIQRGELPIGVAPSSVPRGMQGMVAEETQWASVLGRESDWRRAFGQFSKKLASAS
jgi:hypothetical protein